MQTVEVMSRFRRYCRSGKLLGIFHSRGASAAFTRKEGFVNRPLCQNLNRGNLLASGCSKWPSQDLSHGSMANLVAPDDAWLHTLLDSIAIVSE